VATVSTLDKFLHVRASTSEHRLWKKEARRIGKTVSAWIRGLANRELKWTEEGGAALIEWRPVAAMPMRGEFLIAERSLLDNRYIVRYVGLNGREPKDLRGVTLETAFGWAPVPPEGQIRGTGPKTLAAAHRKRKSKYMTKYMRMYKARKQNEKPE